MKDAVANATTSSSSSSAYGDPSASPRRRKLPEAPVQQLAGSLRKENDKANFVKAITAVWGSLLLLAVTYTCFPTVSQSMDSILVAIDTGIKHPQPWHVVVMACAWCGVFVCLTLMNIREGPPTSVLWNINLTAFVHSIVAVCLATRIVFFTGPWVFEYIGEPNLGCHNLVMLVSLGYFLFDFLYCLFSGTEGWDMIVHHATSTAGLIMGLMYGTCGAELVASVAASEMSNPLWKLRYFLQETGQRDTPVGIANDLTFVATFGICRLGWGTALLISSLQEMKQPIPILLGAMLLYAISMFWLYLMIKMVLKKFRSGR